MYIYGCIPVSTSVDSGICMGDQGGGLSDRWLVLVVLAGIFLTPKKVENWRTVEYSEYLEEAIAAMTTHDQIFEMPGAGLCTLALFVPVSISFRFDLKRSHDPSSAKVVEASQPTKIWVESSVDMVTSGVFVGGTCPKRKVFDRWVLVSRKLV